MPEENKEKETEENIEETLEDDEEKVEIEIEESEIPAEEPIEEDKPELPPKIDMEGWNPRTELGKRVKSGEITSLSEIKRKGLKIMEPEIIDVLLRDNESDLLLIGQAKGKFGGGQRRVFKQTQKKTREGNKPSFATFAVVGNKDGYMGIGYGKSKETVPAREKALRNAKLNIMEIRRGCGSWDCDCKTPHSIPFEVSGKCGSVQIRLIPAPKGTGIVTEPECQKMLKLAGFKDLWSKSLGQTKTKTNLIKACIDALENLNSMKISKKDEERLGIIKGKSENGK